MQLIIIAAGLSLVSAAALPQTVNTDDFSSDAAIQPVLESQGLGEDPGFPSDGEVAVAEVASDPGQDLTDSPGGFETAQGTTEPTLGGFDRAEGEACVAAMIVDYPDEKPGVDCACFCGGLSCINKMIDQQMNLDFRADARIPVSCQAMFDEGDQAQSGPEPFNELSDSPVASSGLSPTDSGSSPLGENPTPGGPSEVDEPISEGEEFLNQNEGFSSQEEQFFRDSIVNI